MIRPARASDEPDLRALDRATWSWDVSPSPLRDGPFVTDDVLVFEAEGTVAGSVALGAPTALETNRHVVLIPASSSRASSATSSCSTAATSTTC